jgi:hypothetical protein
MLTAARIGLMKLVTSIPSRVVSSAKPWLLTTLFTPPKKRSTKTVRRHTTQAALKWKWLNPHLQFSSTFRRDMCIPAMIGCHTDALTTTKDYKMSDIMEKHVHTKLLPDGHNRRGSKIEQVFPTARHSVATPGELTVKTCTLTAKVEAHLATNNIDGRRVIFVDTPGFDDF